MRESPFDNDIFGLVWAAFKKLYPDKNCTCYLDVIEEKTEDGKDVLGFTNFDDDGSITVFVSLLLPICDAAEILTHELAHVAAGKDHGHDQAWRDAFDAIYAEYNNIGYELFPDAKSVTVTDGKAYVRQKEDENGVSLYEQIGQWPPENDE